jgi:hypothetical protein
MRNKKRILLGVAALSIPLASMTAMGPAAFAKKPPPNPVSCSLEATVTLSPQLTVAGVLSSKGADGSASVSGTLFNCSTASGPVGNISIPLNIVIPASKPGQDSAAINAGDNKKDYYLGLCGNFASSGTIKDLKKAVKNLAFAGGVLKGAKPSEGSVGSDVGFNIANGTVKGGTYPTASHAASISAGLTNDSNNSNLISGCQGGPVDHIDIDSSVSTATL